MTLKSALARGQRRALTLMTETCTVSRETRGALSTATDTYATSFAAVYAGPCRVKPAAAEQVRTSGEVAVSTRRYTVSVPLAVATVQRGDVLTVTASADPALVGRPLVVIDFTLGELVTARRLTVEDRS